MVLQKGDKCPAFKLKNSSGELKSLSDYADKKLIIYFYPKDVTPGCTKQACNLRDNFAELKKAGITVVGISPDNEGSHQKFIEKYQLPFELLVDTDHKIAEKFGVWAQKNMYGRKYWGIKRTSFLVHNGKIIDVITKVKVEDHAEQILQKFEENK